MHDNNQPACTDSLHGEYQVWFTSFGSKYCSARERLITPRNRWCIVTESIKTLGTLHLIWVCEHVLHHDTFTPQKFHLASLLLANLSLYDEQLICNPYQSQKGLFRWWLTHLSNFAFFEKRHVGQEHQVCPIRQHSVPVGQFRQSDEFKPSKWYRIEL